MSSNGSLLISECKVNNNNIARRVVSSSKYISASKPHTELWSAYLEISQVFLHHLSRLSPPTTKLLSSRPTPIDKPFLLICLVQNSTFIVIPHSFNNHAHYPSVQCVTGRASPEASPPAGFRINNRNNRRRKLHQAELGSRRLSPPFHTLHCTLYILTQDAITIALPAVGSISSVLRLDR